MKEIKLGHKTKQEKIQAEKKCYRNCFCRWENECNEEYESHENEPLIETNSII